MDSTSPPGPMSIRVVRARAALAVSLCVFGILLLIGCIPVPIPEHKVTGTDFRRFAGDEGQQLHDGVTTRADVLAHLGRPQMESDDMRFAGYYLQTNSGFWLVPLCFHISPSNRFFFLNLEYDRNGVLVRHKAESLYNTLFLYTVEYSPTKARDMFANGFRYFMSQTAIRRPATRPT